MLSVLAGAAAQASQHPARHVERHAGQAAGRPAAGGDGVRRPAVMPCGLAGRPGSVLGGRAKALRGRLDGHLATLLRGGPAGSLPAGGLDQVTDDAMCRLPMDPAAVPHEPFRAAGTMKDALPGGLGDTELPAPVSGAPLQTGRVAGQVAGGPGVVPGGPSGRFGGLPGLGGVVPGTMLCRLPIRPALG
ncbi:hypothetical protein ACRYCC_33675 [Actinomadura scrupuli]|uniref:hypothetical protein n=1 Tax=Actinomadura scrupuli TaxID=559629 RepID=UPI003D983EC1